MDYKVLVTKEAEEDLECFIQYLLLEKQNVPNTETKIKCREILLSVL